MNVYIFDIDGTLSDASHRMHHIQKDPKDWDAFFDACADDPPHGHIVSLAVTLAKHTPIIFVSGRAERCRNATASWLARYGLGGQLYMRADGDHAPDTDIKSAVLDLILAQGNVLIMAFDDRDSVVKMWRERGVPCAQVAPGDF